jgi:hypothetical protein
LNAFGSRELIAFIEGKLRRHGIKKVVPDAATLELAYRRAAAIARIKKSLPALAKEAQREADALKVPAGIAKEVQKRLRDNPAMPWDAVITELVSAKMK